MREAVMSLEKSELEALGIGELMAVCERADLRDLEELACHGNGAIVQVTVGERVAEGELDALEYVHDWEHVHADAEGHRYVIAFTAPDLADELADVAGDLVGTCEPVVNEDGATMSYVGAQNTIREMLDEYESAGVAPKLHRLGDFTGTDDPLADLTSRQREVVETAHELGYYDVPRAASTETVADALDLDPSTVAEHLQRAERNLLDAHLSG